MDTATSTTQDLPDRAHHGHARCNRRLTCMHMCTHKCRHAQVNKTHARTSACAGTRTCVRSNDRNPSTQMQMTNEICIYMKKGMSTHMHNRMCMYAHGSEPGHEHEYVHEPVEEREHAHVRPHECRARPMRINLDSSETSALSRKACINAALFPSSNQKGQAVASNRET